MIQLPLLHRMEERAGERRRVGTEKSPLLIPLPARASRGEEEYSFTPVPLAFNPA
jgi:hypothetical protein